MSEAPKQRLFVSNRDITVRSIHGHSIEFLRGKPTGVPRVMWNEVMEKGILPVDEEGKAVDPSSNDVTGDKPKIVLPPDDKFERDDKVLEAIKAILQRNSSKDFTGGNRPAAHAVTAALGWAVDQKEVNVVWEKHRAALLNPSAKE